MSDKKSFINLINIDPIDMDLFVEHDYTLTKNFIDIPFPSELPPVNDFNPIPNIIPEPLDIFVKHDYNLTKNFSDKSSFEFIDIPLPSELPPVKDFHPKINYIPEPLNVKMPLDIPLNKPLYNTGIDDGYIGNSFNKLHELPKQIHMEYPPAQPLINPMLSADEINKSHSLNPIHGTFDELGEFAKPLYMKYPPAQPLINPVIQTKPDFNYNPPRCYDHGITDAHYDNMKPEFQAPAMPKFSPTQPFNSFL